MAILGVTLSATAQAPADLRVAIVIGNSAYAGEPLANPANDAQAMSAVLKTMGFDVIEARDASRAQMKTAIARAASALKGHNGVGMLYYAGHGLQLDWHNYMVPIDARLDTAAQVAAQTVDLQEVIEAFKAAGNRMNVLVLDACRDSPFIATTSGKGLAPMDAPHGTFLAFATAPGNVADDGTEQSGHGLYTQFLVQELKTPNAKIEDVFKRVRWRVRKESQGRQVPWESTSLEDDFYFDPSIKVARLDDTERLRFATLELQREGAEWASIKESRRPDDLYAFLQRYPNGVLAEQAQFRLDQIQQAAVRPQSGVDGTHALRSGANRYAVGDELVYDRIDGYSGSAARMTSKVTFADDLRVEINGGAAIFDQMGGVVLNRTGRKSPALLTAPAELSVGKRWHTAFTNTTPGGEVRSNHYDFKVVAFEEVTVPAGRFKAYRIERAGLSNGKDSALLTGTQWIDPVTMLSVRNDTLNRSGGKITTYDSEVLVSITHASR